MKKMMLAFSAIVLILVFPQAAADGARKAMRAWYETVAPALFPFLMLMPLLTGEEACGIYEKLFSKLMQRLFALPGTAAPTVAIAMISGSPGGAIAIRRMADSGKLENGDINRMAMALCGLSPGYLVMGIGQELFGSVSLGWKLAGIQAVVQLFMLAASRKLRFAPVIYRPTESLQNAGGIKLAIESILAVCGYMVFFGAVSSAITMILGNRLGTYLLMIADLPGGSAALAEVEGRGRIIIQCAGLGFCGMCIGFQNMDALKGMGISWKNYLAGRVAAAVLFVCGAVWLARCDRSLQALGTLTLDPYAFSLLLSCMMAVPVIVFLLRKIFLNIGEAKENIRKVGIKPLYIEK